MLQHIIGMGWVGLGWDGLGWAGKTPLSPYFITCRKTAHVTQTLHVKCLKPHIVQNTFSNCDIGLRLPANVSQMSQRSSLYMFCLIMKIIIRIMIRIRIIRKRNL